MSRVALFIHSARHAALDTHFSNHMIS